MSSKVLHPMAAFGHIRGLIKQIRIDRLEERLDPAVPFPHKHSFYHLLFLTEGGGWHEIDFERHPAGPRTFFLMKPAQVHSWQLSRDSKGFIIEFEETTFQGGESRPLKSLLQESADFYRTGAVDGIIRGICDFMLDEYRRSENGFEIMLQSCVTQLLVLLHRIDPTPAQTREKNDLLQEFQKLLERYYKDHHDVGFYADEMGMTRKALTMRLSRATGQAPRELIQERCLLESQRLLAYSNLTIAEIAETCGFPDANYFSRFFKKKKGRTPGDFREQTRRLC